MISPWKISSKVTAMRSLMCFDEDNIADRDEFDFVMEDLEALYNRMMKNHPGILITGRLGRWDGPHDIFPVKAFSFDDFMKMFNSDIRAFEIYFVDEEQDVSELQRYSAQWSTSAPNNSVLVKAWHHDGCNIFVLRPLIDKDKDETGEYTMEELEW